MAHEERKAPANDSAPLSSQAASQRGGERSCHSRVKLSVVALPDDAVANAATGVLNVPVVSGNHVAVKLKAVVTAPASPWQNAYCERVIGALRRECLDHVVAVNERQLKRVLDSFVVHYNESRTHLSLAKDAPMSRQPSSKRGGAVVAIPEAGGPHHRYERIAA